MRNNLHMVCVCCIYILIYRIESVCTTFVVCLHLYVLYVHTCDFPQYILYKYIPYLKYLLVLAENRQNLNRLSFLKCHYLTFPHFMILRGRSPASQLTDNVQAMSVSTEKPPTDRSAKGFFVFLVSFELLVYAMHCHKKHYENYA